MEVGDKLNPQRSLRKGFALKGIQHIIKTNNPSTNGPDELLTVHFPDLKENQVIIPRTTKLTFNISLSGKDANKTLVKNFGSNVMRLLVVVIIVEAGSQTENAIKHRINAGDKANDANDKTVASIFIINFAFHWTLKDSNPVFLFISMV